MVASDLEYPGTRSTLATMQHATTDAFVDSVLVVRRRRTDRRIKAASVFVVSR